MCRCSAVVYMEHCVGEVHGRYNSYYHMSLMSLSSADIKLCKVAELTSPSAAGRAGEGRGVYTDWGRQCIFQDFEFGVSIVSGGQHLLDNFH